MHIITRKKLVKFWEVHPDAQPALDRWYRAVKKANFSSPSELRASFPSADQVGRLTVFNIGGNKIRLIAEVLFKAKRIYIREVLTHAKYDEGKWKEK